MRSTYSTATALLLAACLNWPTLAQADVSQNLSDSLGFVLAAYAVQATQGTADQKTEAKELTNALFATAAVTQGLKEVVHAERPDGSGDDSFPSMHASLASAFATVAGNHHPKQRWLFDAYAGAVAWSRVDLDRHHERDVVVGGLLGVAIAKRYSPQHRGYVLGKLTW